jgi:hypothetical protein
MSEEFKRYRGCTGKRRHQTRWEAELEMARKTRQWKLGETVWLEAYHCQFCGCYHLGRNFDPGKAS